MRSGPDETERLWSRYAEVYDGLAAHFPLYADLNLRLAQIVVNHTAPGCHILDAGCGTGSLTEHMNRHARVSGTDITPAMLRRAAAKLRIRQRRPGTLPPDFILADLCAPLPFANAGFDAVTCIHVLYTLSSPPSALRELRRVLRPGGLFLSANMIRRISLRETVCDMLRRYGFRNGTCMISRLLRVGWYNLRLSRLQRSGDMHFWKPDVYTALLMDAGFTVQAQEFGYVADSDLITVAVRD